MRCGAATRGKNRASAAPVVQGLGNYKELGPATARAIRGSVLVTFPEDGHAPQIQDPECFTAALLANLETLRARTAAQ